MGFPPRLLAPDPPDDGSPGGDTLGDARPNAVRSRPTPSALADRLGRRWWLVTAAVLPPVAGAVGTALSVAGLLNLAAADVPWADLLAVELPRAVGLSLLPGVAASAVVVWTAPAFSARPFGMLCAASAAWFSLDSGARDYVVTVQGRGEGVRRFAEVWAAPAVLGGVAGALMLEHRHGRGSVRRREEEETFPRVWREDSEGERGA